jgi:hypothetical protein
MDENRMQPRDHEDELTRRLEAYAEARLTPDLSATTRMRARVMAAAHRQAALARAEADRVAEEAALRRLAERPRRSPWRRPLTALLAAGLTLAVGVGSVAAAQPGGPLYGARIFAETLSLPSEPNARAQAELSRLQDRLAEAAAAGHAGDVNAANAALDAYAAIVNEATAAVGNDVAAAATLETGVRSNIAVLTVLAGRTDVPDAAREAIDGALQRAIDRSDSALDQMHGRPGATPTDSPPGQEGRPTPTPRPTKSANPNKPPTLEPAGATAKPTPRPQATPKPQATPRPERTPRSDGRPTQPPAGGGGGGSQAGESSQAD